MSKQIMALAAVLLAGGIGAASAQQQMPQGQTSQGQTRAATPYSQQTRDTAPLGPNIDKPKVNPSAAGTLTQWRQNGTSSQGKADKSNHEHSGSVGNNANTHPLKALEARGKPRQEGMTAPSGVYPPPAPTMEAGAGR